MSNEQYHTVLCVYLNNGGHITARVYIDQFLKNSILNKLEIFNCE